ncbi:MAG: hypothetical protein HOK97_18815 [Deltaproteobacteria bacterium]|jgi:hypothetical protein|nr:hypothetical protein [Deltaproteobacteria bacterium]MBT6491828.1 hypothetical protein [Deltaproteobacteria bacterium]
MQWHKTCLLILAVGLSLIGCKSTALEEKPTTEFSIGFITGLGGVTEPCGCTSRPLGGLDRMAGLVSERNATGAFGLLLVGNTFYELDNPPGHRVQQEHEKARAIASVLENLKPMGILPGQRDVEVGAQRLQEFAESFRLPVFSGLRGPSELRFKADSALRTIGGHKVGIIGVAGAEASNQADSYTQGALALRRQGAVMVLALVGIGGAEGEALAAKIDGVDIIVLGGEDEVRAPRVIGHSLVVEAGDRGQRLGSLTFHMKGTGAFRYYDEGRSQRSALDKRMSRLESALERMEPGPGREARSAKLEELKAQLAAIQTTPPEGRYVTWEIDEVSQDTAAQSWATQVLTKYNKSLCKLTLAAHEDLKCPPVQSETEEYAGSQTCRTCHVAAYEVYEKTAHSHAWKTLQDKGKDCDVGCVGCHSVGFEKPGGYCRLQDVKPFANVGCENCHGPAKSHSLAPGDRSQWSTQFVRKPTESTCTGCHNEEHSDQFDYETYLPRVLGIGHGVPSP